MIIRSVKMFWIQSTLGWILFITLPGARGCVQPDPFQVIDVEETETGRALITLREPSPATSSWNVSVVSPPGIAAYLNDFVRFEQNATSPSQWSLVVEKALDIERIHEDTGVFLNVMNLLLTCTDTSLSTPSGEEFELFVYVKTVSEYTPRLTTDGIVFNVSEASSVGSEMVDLMAFVEDGDIVDTVALNDVERFQLEPYTGSEVDGAGIFTVLPRGVVILSRLVDFEDPATTSFVLNVTVEDKGGLTSWSTVNICVTNANDNAPLFVPANCQTACPSVTEYRATVNPNVTGPITALHPGNINAIDLDGDPLTFAIASGSPFDYAKFLSIDPRTAQLSLLEPLVDYNISHLTLIIEASDMNTPTDGTTPTGPSHTTVASLLVFVAGRRVRFPAVPTPRNNNVSSASWNTDALFISTLALSVLLLFAILALIVLVCQHRKLKKLVKDYPRASERCNTIKDMNPSDWSIQMRPMQTHGSEKAFMRSVSQATSGHSNSRGYYYDNHSNDDGGLDADVFTTHVAPHYNAVAPSLPDPPPPSAMIPAPGVVPYQEALTHFTSTASREGKSSSGGHAGFTGSSSHHNVYTSGIGRRGSQRNDHQQATDDQDDSEASNLESLYRALDVLTSVTPFPSEPDAQQQEHQQQPSPTRQRTQSMQDSLTKSDRNTIDDALTISDMSNADTLKLVNRRASEPPTRSDASGAKNGARSLDGQDSSTDHIITIEAQMFPLDEFYFDGPVHQVLNKDNNTFKGNTADKDPFQAQVDNTPSNTNPFKQNTASDTGPAFNPLLQTATARKSIDNSSLEIGGPASLSKTDMASKWNTSFTDGRTVL